MATRHPIGDRPKRQASVTPAEPGAADLARNRRSRLAWSAVFWLCAALAGTGVAIATALESPLLGFIGAGFAFLLVVSVFTSSLGRERR